MLSHLYWLHGRNWSIFLLLTIICLTVAGIVASDLRLVICALIVLFIVVPMLMAMLYINFGLDPDCAFNVLPHSLRHGAEGIEACIFAASSPDDDDYDPEHPYRKEYTVKRISYDELLPYQVASDSIIVPVGPHGRGFIYIPASAFDNRARFEAFVNEISQHIARHGVPNKRGTASSSPASSSTSKRK